MAGTIKEKRNLMIHLKLEHTEPKLNKYNRDKGTYANDDGKDASHKDGEIVGFEPSSKNKGRREKSRKGSNK